LPLGEYCREPARDSAVAFVSNVIRHRHLSFEEKTAAFHYPDPLWTYDQGLLIFPSADLQRYALYDLEAGTVSEVDFEPEGKIVRRIRLHEKVLVVEWCEHEPYHQLNENEMVYRHFATAYDITKNNDSSWKINFRSFTFFMLQNPADWAQK
jgi:hypothetical protein